MEPIGIAIALILPDTVFIRPKSSCGTTVCNVVAKMTFVPPMGIHASAKHTIAIDVIGNIAARIHNSALKQKDIVTKIPNRKDRKSTRLNSSHVAISYAGFRLKKKTKKTDLSIRKKYRYREE